MASGVLPGAIQGCHILGYLQDCLSPSVSTQSIWSGRKGMHKVLLTEECWLVELSKGDFSSMAAVFWNIILPEIRLVQSSWSFIRPWKLVFVLKPRPLEMGWVLQPLGCMNNRLNHTFLIHVFYLYYVLCAFICFIVSCLELCKNKMGSYISHVNNFFLKK